ncbi:MAG: RagB/SusD family nutrient uptake outer membrane protein [Bacteroidales bacterium]|nr:RagB/SusD family nutrient uptake outer membrane protein [Bacteroidales bacterium]
MKKLKFLSVFAVIAGLLLMNSCSEEFLEITPNGSLDQSVLATYTGVDALLVGAYSLVDGVTGSFGWDAGTSGWVYGSIRGLEANKGTDSGDQPDINPIQTYSETSTSPYLNNKWRAVYEGISRCNSTIITANMAAEAGTITSDELSWFINQARALRGWYHLEAWRLWADMSSNIYVPYVDENTDQATLTNDVDIRSLIIDDLTAGTNLPNDMGQVGRFNKTVCQFFLAKAYMQMYRDYNSALPLLNTVVTSGTNPAGQACKLMDKYGDIFDIENRNDEESIYTVQYSVNDASGGRNGGFAEVLNFPYKSGGSPGGCCGFFCPTQDFVNSFRTDANGLPLIDLAAGTFSYNDEKVTNDQGVALDAVYVEYAGRLDPRVDWSVGRRGIPYWDWGIHTGQDWIRDQTYSGPYSPKKQVYKQSQEGTYTEVGNWTSGYTANGYRMARYADAILLKAECEAMTGADDLGFGEVNAIRDRAANSDGFVYEDDGVTPAANYVISEYPAAFGSGAQAMVAIKFERKLELGQEGHRYYDLQRWGDVQSELSRILAYEKTMEWGNALYGSATIGAEDVNFPVPQRQIDLANGNLIQNR